MKLNVAAPAYEGVVLAEHHLRPKIIENYSKRSPEASGSCFSLVFFMALMRCGWPVKTRGSSRKRLSK